MTNEDLKLEIDVLGHQLKVLRGNVALLDPQLFEHARANIEEAQQELGKVMLLAGLTSWASSPLPLYLDRNGVQVFAGDPVRHHRWGGVSSVFTGYAKMLEKGKLRLVNSMNPGPETMAKYVNPMNYVKEGQ